MSKVRQNIKQKYISSAFLLLISTLVVKIIGAIYKIPLTSYIGATGRGYFSVAYNLCLPIHALTMGALPIALSKLVSTYNAKGDYLRIKALKKASGRLFFIAGTAGLAVMLIAAKPYAELISSSQKSIYTILTLAPSVFFSCLAAGKRSFAEGYLDMKPTAISQVIESLFKMIFGLLFAKYSMSALYNEYSQFGTVLGVNMQNDGEALAAIYPLTSACAIAGVTLGSIASWIFVTVYVNGRYNSFPSGNINYRDSMQELVLFSVPLIGATVVQSVSNFADSASIQYALTLCSKDELLNFYPHGGEDVYTYVYGIYSSALDFKNLVPSVIMALGVTAVPAVSTAYESSNERFSHLMTSIMKYTSILACGGGVAVSLFCKDMLNIFYSSDNADIALYASPLLFWFGVTMLPCCVASTSVFCVQSLGYSKQTVLPFAISAALKVLLNLVFVGNSGINILGTAVSNFFGFLIIMICNIITLRKKTNCRLNMTDIFVKPIICFTAVYFAVEFVRNELLNNMSQPAELLFSAAICVIFSSVMLFFTGCISLRELKRLK